MNNFLNFLYYTGEPTKLFGIFTMYAICILIGVVIAAYYITYEGKRLGISSDVIYLAIIITLPLAIVGARLWYVIFNLDQFSSFGEVLGFRNGKFEGLSGLAIHGGVIVAAITIYIYARVRKISLFKLVDLMAPAIILGQITGRWGNFFNHELYGPIDTSGFVEHIPLIGNMMFIDGAYRHPVFLYESSLNLICLILMIVLPRKAKWLRTGDNLAIYLTWYGAVRIFTESLRLQSGIAEPLMAGPIPVSILISIIFIVVGVGFFILKRLMAYVKFKNPEKELPKKEDNNAFVYYLKYAYVASTNRIKYLILNTPQDRYMDIVASVKNNKYDAVVFDLDGTLLDSKALIDASVVYTFEKHRPGYKLTEEEIDSFFGPTLQQSFVKYAKDEEELNAMIATYREFNIPNHDAMVKAFPHAKETLKALQKSGIKTGVFSSKKTELLLHGLEICGLDKYVDLVIGFDSVKNPKPDPEGLIKAKKELNANKLAYVGDTKGDIECAIAAGVTAVGVLYIKHPEIMLEAKPDYVVKDLSEIVKIFGD